MNGDARPTEWDDVVSNNALNSRTPNLYNQASADVLIEIEAEIATTQLVGQIVDCCAAWGVRSATRLLDELSAADLAPRTIPIFIRCGDPLAQIWTEALTRAGRCYVYYIDDNFWKISGDSLLANYYRHRIVRRSLEFSISHAEAVITNSAELAEFLAQFSAKVSVLPSFFDFSLVADVSAQDLIAADDQEIRIGFAGSPSRASDLDIVAPLIPKVLERYPNVVFEFIGAWPNGLGATDRIRLFPHMSDYKAYIRFQLDRRWTIGLAPLLDHEANRAKTDNKYREYGAFRCAGIYSAIPPYSYVVTKSVTGLLVDNSEAAWLDALTDLLGNPAKREAIAQQALEDVKHKYDIQRVADRWATFFLKLASNLPADARAIDEVRLKRSRLKALLCRLWLHIDTMHQQGGWRLVIKRANRKLGRFLARQLSR